MNQFSLTSVDRHEQLVELLKALKQKEPQAKEYRLLWRWNHILDDEISLIKQAIETIKEIPLPEAVAVLQIARNQRANLQHRIMTAIVIIDHNHRFSKED